MRQRGVVQDRTDPYPDLGATRLARQNGVEQRRQACCMRALARALGTLEGDVASRCHTRRTISTWTGISLDMLR
jgi:hypothetical protein